MPTIRRSIIAAGVALAMAGPVSARAGSYVFTTFDSVPGALFTYPSAVNAKGQIVGAYQVSSPAPQLHGFVWANGIYNLLDISVPYPHVHLILTDINDAGIAVGYRGRDAVTYEVATGVVHRVVLGSLGNDLAKLIAINNRNEMLGISSTGVPVFVNADGTLTPVPPPAGAYALSLFALSDNGTAIGTASYHDANGYRTASVVFANHRLRVIDKPLSFGAIGPHGRRAGTTIVKNSIRSFVLAGSDRQFIDFPGAEVTGVSSVTADAVFGTYETPNVCCRATFVKTQTGYHAFEVPDAVGTSITPVNADDTVAGLYYPSAWPYNLSHRRLFLATCPPDQRPCTP